MPNYGTSEFPMHEYFIIYLAKEMRPDLVKDGFLPTKLQQYLLNIENYAGKSEGSIQSRQVVALALATWDQFEEKL